MTARTNPVPLTLRPPSASIATGLIVIFVILVGLKCYWVFNSTGPRIFGDEALYKEFAQRIANRAPYGDDAHFPPLYPLLLSLAFLSKAHWYEWMLFINALLSSSIILPIYVISKSMLRGRLIWVPIILTALLPFHPVYSSLLMSENAFLLLFLSAVHLSLIREERDWLSAALVGAVAAMAYMTKYLFLPAIPFLVGLWWLRPVLTGELEGVRLRHKLQLPGLAVVTIGFLAVYAPWLLYAHYSGLSVLREAMGLDLVGAYSRAIASADLRLSGATADAPNLGSLVFWATAYGAYLVLALAPVLSSLALYLGLWSSEKEEIPCKEKLFVVALMVLSIGYSLLALQHSWGGGKSHPESEYILGRYLMHLTPLYYVAAAIALYRIKNQIGSMRATFIIFTSLSSLVLVYVAQRVLYAQAVWSLPAGFAGSEFNSPDSFVYRKDLALWALLALIAAMGMGFVAARANKIFARRYMLPFATACLIVFQLGTFVLICKKTMIQGGWQLHARLLAPVFRADFDRGVQSIALMYDIPGLRDGRLLWSLYFWLEQGTAAKITVRAMTEVAADMPAAGKHYLLRRFDSGKGSVCTYIVDGTRYYLYNSAERGTTPSQCSERATANPTQSLTTVHRVFHAEQGNLRVSTREGTGHSP